MAVPAQLLDVSGTVALVYLVLWIKPLALVVGVDIYIVRTWVSFLHRFCAGLTG